ncbi:MAG: PLP-dependent aminotransferase family protein, partial [Pseudomonadota bacterium]
AFASAIDACLSGPDGAAALQYSVSEGFAPLREWIATRMSAQGIPCDLDNIVITSGSQQALDYLGKLLVTRGETLLVGWPTYLGALNAFNAFEPRFDRLDPNSNRSSADIAQAAQENGGRVKAMYLSTDFANPTGETLDRIARERVLDLAEELDCAIIEDAAYEALRYDGEPLPSIMALELQRKGDLESCRTVYCGSFSKTLSPGLRVGWVVAAKPVISQLVLLKQAADLHSASLNQIAIHAVATAHFDEHIQVLRKVYRSRRDAMLEALDAHMPDGVTWSRPQGGMFIWLNLPVGMDGSDLLARALEQENIAFVPGQAFFADGSGQNSIRLSFSCPSEDQISVGIRRLASVIKNAMSQA